jgi:hypothetical protein
MLEVPLFELLNESLVEHLEFLLNLVLSRVKLALHQVILDVETWFN